MLRIAVFGSGRGSNFLSIVDAIEQGVLPVKIVLVIVNKKEAGMIKIAEDNYLDVEVIESQGKTRNEHEKEIIQRLSSENLDLICLAGYMRILSANFVKEVGVPILNIHPSLLPAFPGLHAQKQALDYGVKISGCTVHLVNEKVDAGKILAQVSVPVRDDDTEETLSKRILVEEHKLYPKVLFDIAMGNLSIY